MQASRIRFVVPTQVLSFHPSAPSCATDPARLMPDDHWFPNKPGSCLEPRVFFHRSQLCSKKLLHSNWQAQSI